MEVQTGSMVLTADGSVGVVLRSVIVNGVRFHRLQRHVVTAWGIVPAQGFKFVSDGEILAVKQTTATTEVVTAA